MEPILLDVPEQIETERLIVRARGPAGSEDVHAALMESMEELRRWMPWASTDRTLEETQRWGREAYAKFITRSDFNYQFVLKDSGLVVGVCGLHPREWEVPFFEIGYWCRTSQTGKGYVSEAVHAVAGMALDTLKARRLEIRCDTANLRSRNVAERCGFVHEATLHWDCRNPQGQMRDTMIFARFSG